MQAVNEAPFKATSEVVGNFDVAPCLPLEVNLDRSEAVDGNMGHRVARGIDFQADLLPRSAREGIESLYGRNEEVAMTLDLERYHRLTTGTVGNRLDPGKAGVLDRLSAGA